MGESSWSLSKKEKKRLKNNLGTYEELLFLSVKANNSRGRSHTSQEPLLSKLKLISRLLLIPCSLAARPFSVAVLPAANQIIFLLQHLPTLALKTFPRGKAVSLWPCPFWHSAAQRAMCDLPLWSSCMNQQPSFPHRCSEWGHSAEGWTSAGIKWFCRSSEIFNCYNYCNSEIKRFQTDVYLYYTEV